MNTHTPPTAAERLDAHTWITRNRSMSARYQAGKLAVNDVVASMRELRELAPPAIAPSRVLDLTKVRARRQREREEAAQTPRPIHPNVTLNLAPARAARAARSASSAGCAPVKAAGMAAAPSKPTGATDIGDGKWMSVEDDLAPWFARHHLMVTDFVADGPFTSLTVKRATLPPRQAGRTSPRHGADGNDHVTITFARGLDPVDMQTVVRHEIGHLADLVAHGDAWDQIGDRDSAEAEAVAIAFEYARLGSGTRGAFALTLASQALGKFRQARRPHTFELR